MTSGKPHALILVDPNDVPRPWRSRLATLVHPTWWPRGLASMPTGDARLGTYRILVATPQSLDRSALSRLPALRLIVATTTAVDYIDLAHCAAAGISVHNTPRYAGTSVAEHAFALLLASVRRLCAADAAARGKAASPDTSSAFELADRTAGVVGLGDIGEKIARIAQGFGMRVLFTSRRPRSFTGAVQTEIDQLVSEADVVFLSVPLTPWTRHLIDRRRLSLMKPTAHLISISPDEVVDLAALRCALTGGALGGAALDMVGDSEPYRDVPGLVLTRRWGIRTQEGRQKRAERWLSTLHENLAAGLGPCSQEPVR